MKGRSLGAYSLQVITPAVGPKTKAEPAAFTHFVAEAHDFRQLLWLKFLCHRPFLPFFPTSQQTSHAFATFPRALSMCFVSGCVAESEDREHRVSGNQPK